MNKLASIGYMIRKTGHSAIALINTFGQCCLFILNAIFGAVKLRSILHQMYVIGVQSLIITMVSGLFIGFVLGLQGFNTLAQFSAESALGSMVSLSILRELGPVVTALLFAGRAGSAVTSEIGLMKATEQLSSLNMMGIDPIKYVVAPRFWAGQICMPLLNFIFCCIAIFGGYLVGVQLLGLYSGTFWSNMQEAVSFYDDIINGTIKSIVFGFAIMMVSVYQGYTCTPNSQGIANATTKTVVYSSLLVLALDFLLTAMMFKGT